LIVFCATLAILTAVQVGLYGGLVRSLSSTSSRALIFGVQIMSGKEFNAQAYPDSDKACFLPCDYLRH
jgi:hypothetical protein